MRGGGARVSCARRGAHPGLNAIEGEVAHEIDVEHAQPDGTHVLDDIAKRVRAEGALFGLAYDFDADRGNLTYVDVVQHVRAVGSRVLHVDFVGNLSFDGIEQDGLHAERTKRALRHRAPGAAVWSTTTRAPGTWAKYVSDRNWTYFAIARSRAA